ncbi:MAG: carboxypeptidase regulatory-like domain-containing protein [Deltaproteobacteria bacterium]|nr:carboxypeptidase regulatory-like domain-containing protein [Deltaproteobacteria bacterium]
MRSSWGIASSLLLVWTSGAAAQPADVTAGTPGVVEPPPAIALGYGAMPGGLEAPSADGLPAGVFGVSLIGGFGFRNKLLSDEHKLKRGIGDIAFAFAPIELLTLGLAFDGRIDKHKGVTPGGDDGYVGDPRLIARLAKKLGPKLTAGGQLAILIPGKDAPSVAASAISVEARGLVTLAAGPGRLSLNAGFRIDNSAKSVVDDDGNDNRMLLSAEDRISLGVSDFHAVVAGVHYQLPLGPKAYLGLEGSMDLFTGAHLPDGVPATDTPGPIIRFGATGGFHFTSQWSAFAFVQGAIVSKLEAADVTAGNIALIPYEPSFTGGIAITARFGGGGSSTTNNTITANDCVKFPEKCKPISVVVTAGLSGSVLDDTGKPVVGAKVTVRLKNNSGTAATDDKGEWTVANVPIGKTVNNKTELDDTAAEVTVEVEGKKPKVATLTLREGTDNKVPPITLDAVLPPGQFKGVIRAAGTGKPIAGVTVKLEPGGASAVSDADGNVSLDVQPGTYKASASGNGYKEQTLDVVIEQSAVVVKQFELTK